MRVLFVVFIGTTLLLSFGSSAVIDENQEDEVENEEASLLQSLAGDSKKMEQGGFERVARILHDLREIEDGKGRIAEKPYGGLVKTKGCQDHRIGDQWGTPEHDNCICLGLHRLCYPVNCLPGSEVVRDSSGPWDCDAGLSRKSITGRGMTFSLSAFPGSSPIMQDSVKREGKLTAGSAATGFGVFADVLGIVGFIFDRVESAQTTEQLNEIQEQIQVLDAKVDELTKSVSDIEVGLDYLEQVELYGKDELRLRNMLATLAKMEVIDGQYTLGFPGPKAWARIVLSYKDDGIHQVMYNLLNMVQPGSTAFEGNSLFDIYHEQLKDDLTMYTEKMPQKVTQMYGLLGGGYIVWMTALRIVDHPDEIPAKKEEAVEELNSLAPSLEKYFLYGPCPSGWQTHAAACYKAFGTWKTWPEASTSCSDEGLGGMLAMAKNSDTNEFLINLKNSVSSSGYYWFGLNDRDKEGNWMWPDGTPKTSFSYWKPGQPDNGGKNFWGISNGNEDCIEYIKKDLGDTWSDQPCGHEKNFICERAPEGAEYFV